MKRNFTRAREAQCNETTNTRPMAIISSHRAMFWILWAEIVCKVERIEEERSCNA